ncbi:MAG: antibiotic biosynthesis monooxygenase [Frankiaceae bacterium]
MATTFLRHNVNDYDEWRQVYDSVADLQRAGGVIEEAVYRSMDDPNEVLVMHRFGSLQEARAFFESDELRAAIDKAGVKESSMRLEMYDKM